MSDYSKIIAADVADVSVAMGIVVVTVAGAVAVFVVVVAYNLESLNSWRK